MEHNTRYQPGAGNDTIMDKLDHMATAHFFTRLVSYIIDVVLIWSASQILIYPVLGMFDIKGSHLWLPIFSVENIASGLLYFLYFVLMTYFFRQTLGKMITGISVIDKDGRGLGFMQVLYRELVGRYINNALAYIPYLMIIFTKNRMGLHDYFADTYVVKNDYQGYKNMIKAHMYRETVNGEKNYQEDDLQNG
ncbi:RDD family protein [Salinicoccus carnicancri]|uniref:RDD family protein n=1 Tax=Salinicoccus carnicancri TaxID=558170 RepID=UPI0002E7AB39|nr:RDD family protein [Salinicoccus carnicancri]